MHYIEEEDVLCFTCACASLRVLILHLWARDYQTERMQLGNLTFISLSTNINCASTDVVETTYQEATVLGRASTRQLIVPPLVPSSCRPLIELCIASSLDPTLAPPGCHGASLFTKYTPFKPSRLRVGSGQRRTTPAMHTDCTTDTPNRGASRSLCSSSAGWLGTHSTQNIGFFLHIRVTEYAESALAPTQQLFLHTLGGPPCK